MSKHFRLLALVALLPLFGLGCMHLGPRIVRAPRPAPLQNIAQAPTGQPSPEEAASSSALAYVQLNGGAAQVTRSASMLPAEETAELFSGDRITVTSGTVTLIYPDAGAAQLEQGSDVVLLSDGTHEGGIFMQLRLTAGRIWTRFERLLGPDERYEVEANGVVATVRGTAFGMSVEADGVDVQVADHEVEIAQEASLATTTQNAMAAPFKISAGQGLKILTRGLLPKDIRILKSAVRQLSVAERMKQGFQFGLKRLQLELLKRPLRPYKLKAPPSVPLELRPYQQMLLRRAVILQLLQSTTTFQAPTRAPTSGELNLLNVTPTIQGPTAPR